MQTDHTPAHIPMLDPARTMQASWRHEAAALRVLRSGRYILGGPVEALEQAWARRLGAPHAVGVSSGTDALLVALMALGVRPGDHVICPTYTFFATAGVIARLGAKPLFVDVCPGCLTLDPHAAAAAVTPLTTACLPVHLFGRAANLAPLQALARTHRLALVEDVAQAMGTRIGAHQAGAVGDMGCYSFFPSKNVGGFGDGGLVVCRDDALADRLRRLRMHGAGMPRYVHRELGGNFRLDALQASLLLEQLPGADAALTQRKQHAARYTEAFAAAGLTGLWPCTCDGSLAQAKAPRPVRPALIVPGHKACETVNQYVVRFGSEAVRDAVAQALAQARIGHAIYYPLPLHLQPVFAHLGGHQDDHPIALDAARTSLALPVAPELHAFEIDRVIAVVVAAIREVAPAH